MVRIAIAGAAGRMGRQLIKATVLSCSTEHIDNDDDFFDYVFVSLVCCSVKDVAASLQEIKRVLKPTGRFIFLEHVAAEPGSSCYHWQQRLNFMWRHVADNCHLNRTTEQSIIDAGFVIEDIQYEKMRKMIAVVQPTIRGIARIAP